MEGRSTPAAGPLAAYRAKLASGALAPDPAQALAAEKLESLHRALQGYQPGGNGGGWRARLGLARRPDPAPQGLYLFGGVGRGKSMMMDLFFASAPVAAKRRIHFLPFMQEVHARLHKWRQKDPGGRADKDPIPALARKLADEARLLCFDEFQVTNIADAMILGRLLRALFDRGVVLVATSNIAPDDLYAGGLQRDRFLPTIALLMEKLDVLELDGGIDHRRGLIRRMRVYHTPLGPGSRAALEAAFARLTGGEAGAPESVLVLGRPLEVSRAARGVAFATFAELCERPLGPPDFLALATHFHTLILDGVPVLESERRDAALRFITLVDALYEHRTKLVCAAAAAPDALYPEGDAQAVFRRAASRLFEMQGEAYLMSAHLT